MSEDSYTHLEQAVQLALQEFQKVLHENLEYKWEPKLGRPPARGYIEQKAFSTDIWNPRPALRAWNITVDTVELLNPPFRIPKKRKTDGMFFEILIGDFGIKKNPPSVSINWRTGPRYGSGSIYPIERCDDGSVRLGEPQPTWIS